MDHLQKKCTRQDRLIFTVYQVVLSHNLGHLNASLLNVLGTMSPEVAHQLDLLDREALCCSKRKHVITEQARTAHRKKYSTSKASGCLI